MNQNKNKSSIPPGRLPIYTAAIASLAMLVVLMIVFVPKLIAGLSEEEEPKTTLRNPAVTTEAEEDPRMNSMLSETVLLGTGGNFTLSAPHTIGADTAAAPEGLYSLPTASPLKLTAASDMSLDALSASLTVTQANSDTRVAVTVTEDANGGFLITPTDGTWQGDTLYRVTVQKDGALSPDFATAFQTAHPFSVKTVYPANERVDVPIDTGIEITFTDPVRRADFASYITVNPPIAGRFELYPDGKTVVIVPDKALQNGTQYAVCVKEGMTADNGQTLARGTLSTFCTQALTTDAQELSFQLSSDTVFDPGSTGNIPFQIYFNDYTYNTAYNDPVFHVKVYAYANADAAVAALRNGFTGRKSALFDQEANLVPTDGMSLVWEGTPEVYLEDTSYRIKGYVYLPPLDAGTYLVNMTVTVEVPSYNATLSADAQTVCQATTLRAYTEGTRGETVVWVNRTDTTPSIAEGVEITASLFDNTLWMTEAEAASGDPTKAFRSVTALTDENGIATFRTEDTDTALLLLRHVDRTLILCVGTEEARPATDFRSYLYSDRAVYFPDDTVRFFGFLGSAYENQPLPETLYLRYGGSETKTAIPVAPDGTFSGSFEISDWMGTYCSFTLSALDTQTGEELASIYHSIRVTQEEKPIYQMSVSYDKLFYTYDDTAAVVTVKTSFFDGTPAAGLRISLSSNLDGGDITLTTDEQGEATYTYTPHLPYTSDHMSTDPVQLYVNATLLGYESVSLYSHDSAYYFHSAGVLEAQRRDGTHSEVTLHALDTSRLLTEEDFYYWRDLQETIKGAPLTDTVTVKLYKTEYFKVPESKYYDPISKKTLEQYYWNEKETLEKNETLTIQDGVLRLEHLDASDFNGHYRYEISRKDDTVGRTYHCTVYANRGRDEFYDPWSRAEQYYLVPSAESALPGDILSATLYYDKAPAKSDTPVLFTRYANYYDRVDAQLIPAGVKSVYSYTYAERDTRFSSVLATVFDGNAYVKVQPVFFNYNFEAVNSAEITVSTDRDTYKPGENAVVSVTSPALAGGTVLVSIVDEACFALGDINTEPLSEYLRTYYRGSPLRDRRHNLHSLLTGSISGFYDYLDAVVETESVKDEMMEAPATGNGASEENQTYVRKDFLDNAAFHVITLDENGNAETTVRVPDNITTWRISVIGVTGVGEMADDAAFSSGVRIGMTTGDAVCTLPLFLNVTLPDLFLCEDEIAFSARCAGTKRAQEPTAQVSYTAILQNEKFEEIAVTTATAEANGTAWFSYDPLPAGEYYVTVTGVLADASDAVRYSFRVTETSRLVDYTETVTPAEISALSPAAFPLTLTFRDNTDALYYETLRRLRYGDSSRTETVAARYAALCIDEDVLLRTPAWYDAGMTRKELADRLNEYSGFLPLNPYAEGDPILTAEVLYCVPDAINAQNKATLVSQYEALLSAGSADACTTSASLMALAAMGEPVLNLVYEAASYAADAPTDAKLYLAAAFAAAGDIRAAEAALTPILTAFGREMPDGSYCISDASTEEAIRLTALALLSASRLPDSPTVMGMVRYLHNHTSLLDLYTLELATFVTYYTPTAAEKSALSFDLAGSDTVSVTIPRGRAYSITLTRSDLESFRVVSADPGIVAEASYGASPTTALSGKADDQTLSVHKTITPFDVENGIYKVTLTFEGQTDVNGMAFSLSDTIPSGARYVNHYYDRNYYGNQCSAWLSHDGGQQLHGSIYIYAPYKENPLEGRTVYSFNDQISYLIRGAVKGTFTAEPTLAISRDADTYAMSECYRVTIKDSEWDISVKGIE